MAYSDVILATGFGKTAHPSKARLAVLMPLCFLVCLVTWGKSAKLSNSDSNATSEFHLHAAEVYEANGFLEQAEAEYLKAGEISSPVLQGKALEGLHRVQARRVQAMEESNQLRLAFTFENQREWSKAETQFAEAAKTARSVAVRNAALNGLARVRANQHRYLNRALQWTDGLPILGRLVGRLLVAVVALLFAVTLAIVVRAKFNATDIRPFFGHEELAKRVSIAFPLVRAKVATVIGTSGLIILPQVVEAVFPFVSPQLNELLPEEAFELGGTKVPNLGPFLTWFTRPRFEINGGVLESNTSYDVYVEVWRRRFWFSARLARVVARRIPDPDPQNKSLQAFIVAVYLEAHASLGT